MSHDSRHGVSQEEIAEVNTVASLMAALNGECPVYVSGHDIERWRDRWATEQEASFPMPHLGYFNPPDFEKDGEPIRVVVEPADSGDGDVLSIEGFLATLTPGYWAVTEYRPGDVDVQRWIPVSDEIGDPAVDEGFVAAL